MKTNNKPYIITLLFLFISSSIISQIFELEELKRTDEFLIDNDFRDIILRNPPHGEEDYVREDIRFDYNINAALYSHSLVERAMKAKQNAWFSKQYNLLEKEIESQLNTQFSNFGEAQKAFYKDLEKGNVLRKVSIPINKYNNKVKAKTQIKRKYASDYNLLEFRANEIRRGVLNSQYGHLQYHGTPLSNLRSLSQIESLKTSDLNTLKENEWNLFIDEKIFGYLEYNVNRELRRTNNFNHPILTELLQKQLNHYNSFDRWQKLDLMQSYLNQVRPNMILVVPIRANDYGSSDFIENFAKSNRPLGIDNFSVFTPNFMNLVMATFMTRYGQVQGASAAYSYYNQRYNTELAAMLNSVNTTEMLAETAITGLGNRNVSFLDARPNLRQKILDYFIANQSSQYSQNAINYLLNQFQDGNDFEANSDLYVSASTPLFQDVSNPNRALEFTFNSQAITEGIKDFGSVLAELLKDNVNTKFEGYIIRNMFLKNGITIPSVPENEFIGQYFDFSNLPSNNSLRINYHDVLGFDLFQLNINTNSFLINSNNFLPNELVLQKQPDYFGQSVQTPTGLSRIHQNAIAISNSNGKTFAFITPDGKFFFWVDTPSSRGWFLEGTDYSYKKNYYYYVDDKYNRGSAPITWGIQRSADDLGGLILNLVDHPNQTISDFAKGILKIITLDFDVEKTWDSILNADLSDASYVVATLAMAHLSGPRGSGVIQASETPQFAELLAQYAVKTRPGRLTWPQIRQLFVRARIFERAVSQHLRTIYKASEGYSVFNQVYLKINGVVSIVDDLIYNANTRKFILNETKYGAGNVLSRNQQIIQDAIRNGRSIEVRSANVFRDINGNVIFRQGSYINISEILRSHNINGTILSNTVQSVWRR